MFSAITSLMPAHSSAYGDCSRLEPLPLRFPLTAATNPPFFTSPRLIGTSLPHFRPVYGHSPSFSSKKKQICAGVISSVEISSRSLGLFCGFFVSQGRSSPASCRRISSGSSVKKRIRPSNLQVSGRFWMLRVSKEGSTAKILARLAALCRMRQIQYPEQTEETFKLANCRQCGAELPSFSFGEPSPYCKTCRSQVRVQPEPLPVERLGSPPQPIATPRLPIATIALLAINIAIFVAMVASGISLMTPGTG